MFFIYFWVVILCPVFVRKKPKSVKPQNPETQNLKTLLSNPRFSGPNYCPPEWPINHVKCYKTVELRPRHGSRLGGPYSRPGATGLRVGSSATRADLNAGPLVSPVTGDGWCATRDGPSRWADHTGRRVGWTRGVQVKP